MQKFDVLTQTIDFALYNMGIEAKVDNNSPPSCSALVKASL